MGHIYTGEYGCLELFAKSVSGSQGTVSVSKGENESTEYPAGIYQHRLIRIPMEKNTDYQVELKDCETSVCYLSEGEDILEKGVCFLEFKDGEWIRTEDLKQWYDTPNREQYHFCPYKNWINDPNGLCWYKGYYHMYYQANPHGQEWNNMYWGHAASKDCVHWVHLPYALEPQEEILSAPGKTGGAFSGSAVVAEDKLLCYLTRHFGSEEDGEVQYQTMVESEDGIHFKNERRIIDKPDETFSHNFRDPKVIWLDGCWQMVIGTIVNGVPSVVRYASNDGYHWEYQGILLEEKTEGVYTFECPDFFMLDGKMVVSGSWMCYSDEQGRVQPTYYYVGDYQDGKFVPESKGQYDFGSNFYAVQSFEHEGRRIAIGWAADFYQEHCPEENGAYGSMAIPRELFFKEGKLYRRPIREIYELKGKCFCNVSGQNVSLKHLNDNSYYARLGFKKATDFDILLGRNDEGEIRLVRKGEKLQILTTGVKSHLVQFVTETEKLEEMEIFVDHRMVEVFVNGGEEAGTKLFYQKTDGIFEGKFDNEEAVKEIEIYEMKGIWG
ncbi:MAG: glycoside hydrolase family 32 protein [Clostridiales bacterium]|nr:glycoside hydrolase family 32 protein [Clostridiales bacterium]